jgi:hypothetical protein
MEQTLTTGTADIFPLWIIVIVIILVIWSTIWKGIALWKSARLSHKRWFIVMLVINTFGILEIFYIFFIARKYTVETIEGK